MQNVEAFPFHTSYGIGERRVEKSAEQIDKEKKA
jgi:hypothetical protein